MNRAGHVPRRAARELEVGLPVPAPGRAPSADGQRPPNPCTFPTSPRSSTRIAVVPGVSPTRRRSRRRCPSVVPGAPPLRRGVRGAAVAAGRHPNDPGLDFRRRRPCAGRTVAALKAMGFARPEHVGARAGLAGRACAGAAIDPSAGSHEDAVAGDPGAQSGAQPHPDETFSRFDRFLRRSPPGCSCCRCSSAIRRCWTASPRYWARRPGWPITGARTPRPWRDCCHRADEGAAAALRRRLRGGAGLEEAIESPAGR